MQALRDAMSQLKERNAVVFGVSADTVESHKQFAEKEMLNFPLLADPEAKMIESYGALIPGRKMANRYTFVIGPDGKVAGIDRNVNQQFDRGQGTFTSEHGLKLALALTDWKAKLGSQTPYFSLPGHDGKTVGFTAGKKATVIAFVSTRDPMGPQAASALEVLSKEPANKEVAFLLLAPNRDETAEQIATLVKAHGLALPIALDAGNRIADRFGVKVTPTVWVLDAKGTAVYTGALDDPKSASPASAAYVRAVLDALVAGRPVGTAETKALGAPIKRARRR